MAQITGEPQREEDNYEEKHLRRSRTGCSIGIRRRSAHARQPKGDYGSIYRQQLPGLRLLIPRRRKPQRQSANAEDHPGSAELKEIVV